ncbi:DUF6671 family protein [Leifsonia sp. AG29]|uniref:DUF6671 family protein n=1 Tax=Leifsonia sp. AG29 TaxID=2598860 RepID=UPI00131BA5BB|nr:DUF6671 family protein [Leifsonia sp. AG29]
MSAPSGFRGVTIVFATRHGKEEAAREAFADQLGARVIAPARIDTDRFGTFTGDIPRTLSPRQAALAKAQLGMVLTGTRYGLASEATYTSTFGVLTLHHELLLFHDRESGLTVTENARVTTAGYGTATASSPEEALSAATRFGFPATAAVLSTDADPPVHRKGIRTASELESIARLLLRRSPRLRVEADYRAHNNPPRRDVIRDLSYRMTNRLGRHCPDCGTPGYGAVDVQRGLPCSVCGQPTAAISADIHGCALCPRREAVPRPAHSIDPQWCDSCNP